MPPRGRQGVCSLKENARFVMRDNPSLYALTTALQPVRRAWGQVANRVVEGTGLPTALATAVLIISRLGPNVQQKELAFEIGVNPAALVRVLDQGEALGVLSRTVVEGDRRSKTVDLLPEGHRLAATMEQGLAKLRTEILGGIPIADIETATRVLREMEQTIIAKLESASSDAA